MNRRGGKTKKKNKDYTKKEENKYKDDKRKHQKTLNNEKDYTKDYQERIHKSTFGETKDRTAAGLAEGEETASSHTGVCEKILLQKEIHIGISAFRAPNQGLECLFCRRIVGRRLP